ncbi:hypothetical protein PROFUN_12226 [Planoprotostelium fungivorum]|uniref:Uncharacterized protein n=1 Tax=Planoprotostelium fungivorum TaxID=1890364 RepID=A0A2P6N868_9EUKA|nr:hypothetical protein PROFUN_12226 [Planoprotostelium fungivorum]
MRVFNISNFHSSLRRNYPPRQQGQKQYGTSELKRGNLRALTMSTATRAP